MNTQHPLRLVIRGTMAVALATTHTRLNLNDGDLVEVQSDTQANVILTTDADYGNYKADRSYNYYGGFYTHFPARIAAPHSGYWNVILDLGGGAATVRHSITVVRR